MNVSASLVAKMLSVKTPREDIVASVRPDSLEIPTLPVREKLKLSSAPSLNLAPVENSVPKENVFVREASRESQAACVGMWTSVLKQLLKKSLPVVSMPSVKTCQEVLTANALQVTMEIHS